jgi:hypothetical protein
MPLHAAAKRVYDAGGPAVLRGLWTRFRVADEKLVSALDAIEPALARVLLEWPTVGNTTRA